MTKMKHLYLFIMTIFVSYSFCYAQENSALKKSKTIICGHSDLYKNETQSVTIDFLGITSAIRTKGQKNIDRETGNFKFEIDIPHSQDIYLEYTKKLTLFISPGDSLFINFDKSFSTSQKSDIINHVTFSGPHSKINRTIFEYEIFKGENSFSPDCNNKSVDQYKSELSNWIDRQNTILNQFVKQKETSKEFVNWAKYDNIYSNANYLIDYMFYLDMNKKPLVGDLFDTSIFPVDNDEALISRNYRLHLNQYFQFKYYKDSIVQSLLFKKDYYSGFKYTLNLIIKNEPSGISRDIMINDLFNMCLSSDFPSSQKLKDETHSFISNKYLRTEFEKHYFLVKNQHNSIEFLSAINNSDSILGDFFRDVETRYKGKVIYLDFWATWCSPCRAEFPYSSKLSNLYMDKNVEFIYVCMNSTKDNWENTLKTIKLNSNQYYLNEAQSHAFSNKFQMIGFPTYYLINKKGQLVDKNAPRPSSAEVKDKIDILLEE